MKGGAAEYTTEEQAIREFTTLKRAEYAFKQKIEKQRWEQRVLVPAVKAYQDKLTEGTAPNLELADAS